MDRRLLDILQEAHPALVMVVAVFLMILGILVVAYPSLLSWVVGIALFLAGVALLAFVFTERGRSGF